MKKIKLSIHYLIIFIIMVLSSCEKKPLPNELPPLTMTGENTFGCLINDEVFVPAIRRFIGPDSGPNTEIEFNSFPSSPDFLLSFSAHRRAAVDERIKDVNLYFGLSNIKSLGIYSFYEIMLYYRAIRYSSILENEINIVYYDSIAEIISGTFKASIYNDNDTMQITDGRFDIKVY